MLENNFKGVVKLKSDEQLAQLKEQGSIVIGGKTILYSPNDTIYVTPETDKENIDAGLVIQADNTITVQGYAVPNLTAEQVTSIYNAVAGGKTAVVTDPTGNYHFTIDQADNMAGIISCEYKFFNTMYVTYELDNETVTVTGSLIGGGKTYYKHLIRSLANNYFFTTRIINDSPTAFTGTTFTTWLRDKANGHAYEASGTLPSDGAVKNIVCVGTSSANWIDLFVPDAEYGSGLGIGSVQYIADSIMDTVIEL